MGSTDYYIRSLVPGRKSKNSVHTLHSLSLRYVSMSSCHSTHIFRIFFSCSFSYQNRIFDFIFFSLRATCPAHLFLLHLVLTISGESYTSCRSLLCCFLQPPATRFLLRTCSPEYHTFLHAVAQLVEAPRYKSEGRGSIPDGVIGIFHWHNTSDRTMAMGLTQPLAEMSTRNISLG
jgi:hypothetical protein